MTRPRRVGAVAAFAAVVALAVAGCGAGAHAARSPAPAARASFSPYVDVTVTPAAGLPALARRAGLRSLTLAFVIGRPHACRATWEGQPLTGTVPPSTVAALGAAGTATVVSFGGRDGPELAQACSTPAALARQYQAVIDTYRPARLDFDIEGASQGDASANARRWAALRTVLTQSARAGRPLPVSLTLPVSPGGLDPEGLTLLRGAVSAGVQPAQIDLLAMDYGPDLPSRTTPMSTYAERSAASAATELRPVYGSSAGLPWSQIAITSMVGRNDTRGETFTLADARRLTAFAGARQLAGLSMWSLGRDRPCPPGTPRAAQATCSGVTQAPLEFARLLGS